ncbi:MAG: TasA family protein [Christensenellales bacterium]
MNKRVRTMLLSMIVVCLSLTLVIGGTYALFSDQVTVNNHLAAGSLDVGLQRISYQACEIGSNGMLSTGTANTTTVDLTADNSSLFSVDKAVPGSWYQADIRVSNNGDVAFDYGVRILWDSASATPAQTTLAGQIRITVSVGSTQMAQFVLTDLEDVDLGSILADGAAQVFTVKAEFVNSEENNAAQQSSLDFDLQVYAVQKLS